MVNRRGVEKGAVQGETVRPILAQDSDSGPFRPPEERCKGQQLTALKKGGISGACERGTEMTKSQGRENIAPENAISPPSSGQPVTSPTAMTFGNNGHFPPSAAAEKLFLKAYGAPGRIRTSDPQIRSLCPEAPAWPIIAPWRDGHPRIPKLGIERPARSVSVPADKREPATHRMTGKQRTPYWISARRGG